MMRAIRVSKFGPPDVLQCLKVAVPTIGSNEVLVEVKAAGVNPVDTYIRSGAYGVLPKLPYTPGKDGAGIVHSVGNGITNFKKGDRVYFCTLSSSSQFGSYAEYAVVDEHNLWPLDDTLTFSQGAAIGIPYFTAYRALCYRGNAKAGQNVFVHGASGAVGQACIQIGSRLGLNVFGTAGSEEGLLLCSKLGCTAVFNHNEKGYEEKVREACSTGFSVVVEMLANVNLGRDLELLCPGGTVVIVGSRGKASVDPRLMMGPETLIAGCALTRSTPEQWNETAEFVQAGIKSGWIQPRVSVELSLDQAAKAHHDVINTSSMGKIVLLP